MINLLNRVARVAYAFVLMNYAAVAALLSLSRQRALWR